MHHACHALQMQAIANQDKKDCLACTSDNFTPLTLPGVYETRYMHKCLMLVPWIDL